MFLDNRFIFLFFFKKTEKIELSSRLPKFKTNQDNLKYKISMLKLHDFDTMILHHDV